MAEGDGYLSLPVPAVTAIKQADAARAGMLRGQMERSTTADIRAEGQELKEAAEQTLNVILDVTLDGNIRWASPTWKEVFGTTVYSVLGRPVGSLILDNPSLFTDAIESLKKDDSGSKIIRFAIVLGPHSVFKAPPAEIFSDDLGDSSLSSEADEQTLNLEAQGIMVYDRSTGAESHVRRLLLVASSCC